jgi:hypothetical protein
VVTGGNSGAKPDEVCVMGTLTANLHLMMSQFYKPTPERFKLLCEAKAFPSDQVRTENGWGVRADADGRVPVRVCVAGAEPRVLAEGCDHRDWAEGRRVLDQSRRHAGGHRETGAGDRACPVRWPFILQRPMVPDGGGHSGRTGKGTISRCEKDDGLRIDSGRAACVGGTWRTRWGTCRWRCTTGASTLRSGARTNTSTRARGGSRPCSSTSGGTDRKRRGEPPPIFHFLSDSDGSRYAGWWGQTVDRRFQMRPTFSPIPGAHGFQQSNPAVLTVASLLGSLQTFKHAGMMGPLRERSKALTGLLDRLLRHSRFFVAPEEALERTGPGFTIITPPDPESRGAQLSLLFLPQGAGVMDKAFAGLKEWGVIGDDRKPDVIRLAPTPLYNTQADVEAAAKYLDLVLARL